MNIRKHLKGQLLFAFASMVIGVIALVILYYWRLMERSEVIFLFIRVRLQYGFLLGGILLVVDYFITSRNPSRKNE